MLLSVSVSAGYFLGKVICINLKYMEGNIFKYIQHPFEKLFTDFFFTQYCPLCAYTMSGMSGINRKIEFSLHFMYYNLETAHWSQFTCNFTFTVLIYIEKMKFSPTK